MRKVVGSCFRPCKFPQPCCTYIKCVWRAVQLHILSEKKEQATFGSPRWELRPSRANLGFKNDFISLTIDLHAQHTWVSKYIHKSTKTQYNQYFYLPTLPPPLIRFPLTIMRLVVWPATSIPPPPPRERFMYITRPHGCERHCPAAYVRLSDTPLNELLRLCARTDHGYCGTNTRWRGYRCVCWI